MAVDDFVRSLLAPGAPIAVSVDPALMKPNELASRLDAMGVRVIRSSASGPRPAVDLMMTVITGLELEGEVFAANWNAIDDGMFARPRLAGPVVLLVEDADRVRIADPWQWDAALHILLPRGADWSKRGDTFRMVAFGSRNIVVASDRRERPESPLVRMLRRVRHVVRAGRQRT